MCFDDFTKSGFNIKEILNTLLFNCAVGAWNEKHHTFWLVILFWHDVFYKRFSNIINSSQYCFFFLPYFLPILSQQKWR